MKAFSQKAIRKRMRNRACATILALAFCSGMTWGAAPSASAAKTTAVTPHLPPYHAHPPRGPLPQVLPWTDFTGNAHAENAYYLAARIRPVLYQQPCFCPCGKALGHTCLLDCFTRADKHAAMCGTCLKEAIFAYQQAMQGADAQTIRVKMIKGEWKKVDLTKYNRPPGE